MRRAVVLVATLLLPLGVLSQNQANTLANSDVVSMLNAGITPEVVIAKIRSGSANFDTSPDALAALKGAHVPDEVILAMVQAPPPTGANVAYVKCGTGGKEVYLLSSPTGPGTPVKTVKCGDRITMLDEQNGWYRARTQDGTEGYVSHYFVSDSNGNSLPTKAAESSSAQGSQQPQASPSNNRLPSNMLRAVAWRGVPWATTSYYQQSGSADTDCTGSGSWVGSTYQGNASCSTRYTPAQSIPLNWQHYTIYNLVETADSHMVIACTRNWAFSKCSSLVPGSVFRYDSRGGKISVSGERGGKGKPETVEYEIVSRSPN